MFIEIKYGAEQKCLMNPDCRQVHFTEYLVEKLKESGVHFDSSHFLDLVCESSVTIINLRTLKKDAYVSAITTNREVYVPISIKKIEDASQGFSLLFYEPDTGQTSLAVKVMQTLMVGKGKLPKTKMRRSNSLTPEPEKKRRTKKNRGIEPRSSSRLRRT